VVRDVFLPPADPSGFWLLGLLPFLLLGLGWLLVAAIFALRGDTVDKPARMPQLYGYTVCLIALVVAIVSVSSIVGNVFERGNPLRAGGTFGPVLTSFDAYKATRSQHDPFTGGGPAQPDTASEATLRRQYDALVTDRIAATQYRTTKSLTTDAILLVIAFALFASHWRWVRRFNGSSMATP